MDNSEEILRKVLDEEKGRVRSSYPKNDVIFPLVEIIRTLDYHTLILKAKLDLKDQAILLEKYRFGWALAFQLYYKDLELSDAIPLFSFEKEERDWVDQIVQHAGAVQVASQLLDYCKADLMTLSDREGTTFVFDYIHENLGV